MPPIKSSGAGRSPLADRAATRFLSESRGRPPIQPIPRAGAAVARVVKPIARQFGTTLADLSARWPEIAGERLARLARPVRLSGGRDGATLTLLARGPAATLLQAESTRIIERANQFCGPGAIARIRIQQGPLHDSGAPARPSAPRPVRGLAPSQAKSLADAAEGAHDPALRAALQRLGRAVLTGQD